MMGCGRRASGRDGEIQPGAVRRAFNLLKRRPWSFPRPGGRGKHGGGGGTADSTPCRSGPDYAFTSGSPRCGACYESPLAENFHPSAGSGACARQPVYESLQGRPDVGRLPTPRRYPVAPSATSGFTDVSSVFTLPSRAGATIDRTRVRKPYASRHYVRSRVIVLVARYPTGREDVRPASERFNSPAWSTPELRSRERVPRFWMHEHMPGGG